jgi:hypothetical protein
VAKELNTSMPSVSKWRGRWSRAGVAGPRDAAGRGRKASVSPKAVGKALTRLPLVPLMAEPGVETFELVFIEREDWIGTIGEFGPSIAGLGLEGGGKSRRRQNFGRHRSHRYSSVHITLHEKGLAAGIGMLQFEDRLAIVKVMAGEKQVQAVEPFAQMLDFILVELSKVRRDARRVD